MDPASVLPEDVFAGVLRRLAPRDLAASRCASKAWRAVVDGHHRRLLDPFPRSLDGIFFRPSRSDPDLSPGLFCRRSTARKVSNKFDNLNTSGVIHPWMCGLYGHCNGLLLLSGHVVNPATRQFVPLPPMAGAVHESIALYLSFDPAVSPHYEVCSIPNSLRPVCNSVSDRLQEWPPPSFGAHVFSSRT